MDTSQVSASTKLANAIRDHWATALLPLAVITFVATALFANPLAIAGVGLVLVIAQGLLLAVAGRNVDEANAQTEIWRARAEAARRELLAFRQRAVHEDHETTLGNRRQLEIDWGKAMARFRRHTEPFCIVIFQIRHALGRSVTDYESVMGVAGVLVRAARAEDSVCRIDEGRFAILLSGSDELGGMRFIQRARVRANTELFERGGKLALLELIGGVAEWDDQYGDLNGLMTAAEANLGAYAADYERQVGEFQSKALRA